MINVLVKKDSENSVENTSNTGSRSPHLLPSPTSFLRSGPVLRTRRLDLVLTQMHNGASGHIAVPSDAVQVCDNHSPQRNPVLTP
jgi:hypothetical protein